MTSNANSVGVGRIAKTRTNTVSKPRNMFPKFTFFSCMLQTLFVYTRDRTFNTGNTFSGQADMFHFTCLQTWRAHCPYNENMLYTHAEALVPLNHVDRDFTFSQACCEHSSRHVLSPRYIRASEDADACY